MPKHPILSLPLLLLLLTISVSAQIGPVIQRNETIRFAVIGDYGDNSHREAEVAALVHRLAPDFIITTGDNNYPAGQQSTIDQNIGQYYSSFISPYYGGFEAGTSVENRFFPALGNHDWETGSAQPYLDYFTLPGNERYYEFPWGPVRLFAIDSDPHEPDGTTGDSIQGEWLRQRLAATTEPWRIVYMHHPPLASAEAYGNEGMRWPYQQWGASAVFAGHAHNYERLEVRGIPYFVNGLGGAYANNFDEPSPQSQFRFNAAHGAMLVEATDTTMSFNFHGIYGRPLASMNRVPGPGRWLEFDVTQAIQGDGTYSFVVDSTFNGLVSFSALESGAERPHLFLFIEGRERRLRVHATEDATVDSLQPDALLGMDNFLYLGRQPRAQQRIFLQFQVSGLDKPLNTATLRIYLSSLLDEGTGGIAVYRAGLPLSGTADAWTDEAISWNNAPNIIVDETPIDTYTLQR